MTSGPITSWHVDGEAMEIVTDFLFLGSKIIANGDCSQEIKRHLLLGIKANFNTHINSANMPCVCGGNTHHLRFTMLP